MSPLPRVWKSICQAIANRRERRPSRYHDNHRARLRGFESLERREMLAADFGEMGMMTLQQPDGDAWQTVQMSRDYVDPVVIAGPLSINGSDPAMVRVRNVDAEADTFEVQIDEWIYLDGWHTDETFSYMVVERGTHVLEDGTLLEAGTIDMNLDRPAGKNWFTQDFSSSFSDAPVVFTQLASANGPDPAVLQQRGISSGGFQLKLREEEKRDNWHVEETVSWLAIEAGPGTNNGNNFIAGTTGKNVTHQFKSINFGSGTFDTAPAFLASMQTTAGSDTANVRYRNLGPSSVQVQIDEETSKDKETKHTAEDVGYLFWQKLGEDPTLLFEKPAVDLDVNSDNKNEFNKNEFEILVLNEQDEDTLESRKDLPGKYVAVNENDKDGDGVVDFADGFNRDGGNVSDNKNINEQFIAAVVRFDDAVDLDTAKFRISYSASDPNGITVDEDGALVPAPGHLRAWKWTPSDATRNPAAANAMTPGDYIAPGDYSAAELGVDGTGEAKLLIEGIAPSTNIGDQQIVIKIDADGDGPDGFTPGDAVRLTVVNLDLDIDADNNNGFGAPQRNRLEDQLEGTPAPIKLVAANTFDLDGDGIPDYADGYDLDDANADDNDALSRFTPVKFTVPETIDLDTATFLVVYSASDPLALATESLAEVGGALRIWTVDGTNPDRSGASVKEGGSYIGNAVDPYTAEELTIDLATRTATWYVEGVQPSFSETIAVFVDVDGPGANNAKTAHLFDFVSVQIDAALDLDVNNANGLWDTVDGVANFLPGYVGTTQALTSLQEQHVNIIASGLVPGSTVKLKLANTSKLPGIASNFDAAEGAYLSGEGDFDYVLVDPDGEGEGGATLAMEDQLLSGMVVGDDGRLVVPLSVRDFGGSTTVQILDGDDNIIGSLQVPLDQDGDKLPDLWEDLYAEFDKTNIKSDGTFDDMVRDRDVQTDGNHGFSSGDGLQAFDEYRGFVVGGEHERSDPMIKTVFLKDETGYQITDGGGGVLSLVSNVGVHTLIISDGEADGNREISFNGFSTQRAIFVESTGSAGTDGNWGRADGRSPSDYTYSHVWIDLHTRSLELLTDLPDDSEVVDFVIYRESDVSSIDPWALNGRVRIGNEILRYEEGIPGRSAVDHAITAPTAVSHDTTTVILGTAPLDQYGHVLVEETGEVIDLAPNGVFAKASVRIGTIEPIDADADVIITDLASASEPPVGEFFFARLGAADSVEWVTYTGVDSVNGKLRLTGVVRGGILGTAAVAHPDGMPAIYIPSQVAGVKRGVAGSTAAEIPDTATLIPVGLLTNVERAQDGTQHALHVSTSEIAIFANVNDAIRNSAAHEAVHSFTNGPGDEHIANTIMHNGLYRGRYLNGPDPALYTQFDKETKDHVDAK